MKALSLFITSILVFFISIPPLFSGDSPSVQPNVYNLILKADSLHESSPEQALTYLDEALSNAAESKNYEALLKIYQLQSRSFIFLGEPNSALKPINAGIKLAKQKKEKEKEIDFTLNKGRCYLDLSEFEDSKENYEKALILSQKINYQKGINIATLSIGSVYYEKGEFPQAVEYFLEAVKLYIEQKDYNVAAGVYSNIALVYNSLNDYENALLYNHKALEILPNKPEFDGRRAYVYNNIGMIFEREGAYEKAKSNYLKSLEIHERMNDKNGIISCNSNLGNLALLEGDYKAALDYYEFAEELTNPTVFSKSYIILNINLGYVYKNLNNYNEALKRAENAYTVAKKSGAIKRQKEAIELKTKIFESKSDYKNAYLQMVLLNEINDSLYNLSANQVIEDYRSKSLALESNRAEAQKLGNDKKFYVAVFAAGVLLILLVLVYFKR
jgi:tetratricopeptide (TPR) repeat protein